MVLLPLKSAVSRDMPEPAKLNSPKRNPVPLFVPGTPARVSAKVAVSESPTFNCTELVVLVVK